MTLFESLDDLEKTAVFSKRVPVEPFTTCLSLHFKPDGTIETTTPYSHLAGHISSLYFLSRSGDKITSPYFDKAYQRFESGEEARTVMGRNIAAKFSDKWVRIYNSMVANEYDPNVDHEETRTSSEDNSKRVNYGSTTTEDGQTSTNITTTFIQTDINSFNGFNSVNPVDREKDISNNSETVTGSADGNTTHSSNAKTGTDTTQDNKNVTETISGRTKSIAETMSQEIDFLTTKNFFDIISADVDTILACKIYSK